MSFEKLLHAGHKGQERPKKTLAHTVRVGGKQKVCNPTFIFLLNASIAMIDHNQEGPRTEPWGTPHWSDTKSEVEPPELTSKTLSTLKQHI